MHRSALKTHKAKSKSRKKAKQQNETKRTKCKIRALKWEINIKTKGENDVEWRKNGKVSHLAIDMRSQRRRCWSRQAGGGNLGKAGLSRGVGGRLRRLPHNCAATCGLCGRFCPMSVCIFCRQTNFQLNICALVVVVVAAATRAAAAATRNGLEFKINAI